MDVARVAVLHGGIAAVRTVRALKELAFERSVGLTSIALWTDDDRYALHVREADERHRVVAGRAGPPGLVDVDRLAAALARVSADAAVIGAARVADPAAVADLCEGLGVASLGPSAATLRLARDEAAARSVVEAAGLAVAGRAGASALVRLLDVQVVADHHGAVWALGVRDRSVRSGDVALVDEAPSPGIDADQDAEARGAAVQAVQALGATGVVNVVLLFDPASGRAAFVRIDAGSPLEQPVTELTTGLDLVKLQLRVGTGERLAGAPPPVVGHALEAHVRLEPAAGGAVVELLRFPAGPGLRVDAGVEEGDVVPGSGTTIARVAAHGRTRAEAVARLHGALAGAAVQVQGAGTNRATLQHLVGHPDLRAGRVDLGWVDRLAAAGEDQPGQCAEVALCQVAVLAFEDAAAYDRDRFLATAARGRPHVGRTLGHEVRLRHDGAEYTARVLRIGPHTYRVACDGATVDVDVDAAEAGRHRNRLAIGDRTYRVLWVRQGDDHVVEVDGAPSRVAVADRGIVRAPAPSVVVAVTVEPGDVVAAGDAVVVLEAMKTETVLAAGLGGQVAEVLVRPNDQVGVGDPLLVLVPVEAPAGAAAPAEGRIDLRRLVPEPVAHHDDCLHRLEQLRWLLLGFDVEPPPGTRGAGTPCRDQPVDPADRRRREDEILEVFVDVAALFRRTQADDDPLGFGRSSTEEHLFTYLRDLEAEGKGLPAAFLDQLRRTLRHYGVTSLAPSAELQDALYRIARSQQRMDVQLAPVVDLLEQRLHQAAELRDDAAWRHLLDRVLTESRQRHLGVHDLAEEVWYRTFDQPVLADVRTRAYAEAEAHLVALAGDPDGPDRAAHVTALVDCTQPLKALLSARYAEAPPAVRCVLLEVMTRRYYRVGEVRDLATSLVDGRAVATARCTLEGAEVHLLSTHVEADDVAGAVDLLGRMVEGLADDRQVLVDLYVWSAGPPADLEAASAELRSLLAALPARVAQVVASLSSPSSGSGTSGVQHLTFRREGPDLVEDRLYRTMHPMMGRRLELWRLQNFDLEVLPSVEDVYLFLGRARENARDERLFVLAEVRDLTAVRDESGEVLGLPELERTYLEALQAIRRVQSHRPAERRLEWNRVLLYVWPPIDLQPAEIRTIALQLAPAVEGLGLEKVAVHGRMASPGGEDARRVVIEISSPDGRSVVTQVREPNDTPFEPLTAYTQKVVQLRRRGLMYPYELVRVLAPPAPVAGAGIPPGRFQELDLDGDELVPVSRPPGQNQANMVVGMVTNVTARYPEGMRRVALLGDPSKGMGALAEPECRRIMAALDLAEAEGVPLEWFAVSGGALIAMDSGTENMDWIARVLRRIIDFTQAGCELNVVVCGINVGAQPYWNAEATMLMHTRGILVMTPEGAMVLTGKQALDYSGGVSAEDNQGIGGYERVMGRNGQAQYLARDLTDACRILLRHYDHAYVAPGECFPRPAVTTDPPERDVREAPHGGQFATVGEVFSEETNPGRKKPFEIRRVMSAVVDRDHPPLERWFGMQEAETSVVWDAHLGGRPVCLLGLESKPLPRLGVAPADGPETWTSGTLFPLSSKKVARAINSASGSRPVVVLANLSGFDGSPESMRRLQLEYGAEIGRAVVNFRGPIVFCVISRYHGGAFVVFSKALNEHVEVAAIEGAHASVIGGAPAAAVVFARDVERRTQADERVVALRQQLGEAQGVQLAELRRRYEQLVDDVRSEKLGEVAAEFDGIHDVERARRVGSVDLIIPARELRPYLVDAIERGMRRYEAAVGPGQSPAGPLQP